MERGKGRQEKERKDTKGRDASHGKAKKERTQNACEGWGEKTEGKKR